MADVQLPLWVEYIKALGAPFVALVAACVGGGIAYRQWQTARNKLKLEFFDRRVKIYDAAVSMVGEIVQPSPAEEGRLPKLVESMAGCRWILNIEITEHLLDLLDKAEKRAALERDLDNIGVPLEQRELEVPEYRLNKMKFIDVEVTKLNKLFAPFLSVKH